MNVTLLSGGAAEGLVSALTDRFKAETGADIAGTFSAVGAMRDKLVGGAPCDVAILSRALIDGLIASGHVVAGSRRDLGTVRTGIAVRAGNPVPSIANSEALAAALQAADAIFMPDPKLATAGIHFAKVIDALGLTGELAPRLRPFPNGMTAMRELVASKAARPLGCTQMTELLHTPGLAIAGPLPKEHELSTVYSLGIAAQAVQPELARRLAELLAGAESQTARQAAGFEAS